MKITRRTEQEINISELKAAIKEGRGLEVIRPHDEITLALDTGETITPVCGYVGKHSARFVFKDCLREMWQMNKDIKLLDPNITACKDRLDLLRQLADSGAWVDFTQGVDCRTLTKEIVLSLNAVKTKMIHFALDFMEQSDAVVKGLELYAQHGAITDERKRRVYVLTNYNTTQAENLHRIYTLRNMGYDPYVMIYDKPHAPREIRLLQRWVNNKIIFRKCERFEDYDPKRR